MSTLHAEHCEATNSFQRIKQEMVFPQICDFSLSFTPHDLAAEKKMTKRQRGTRKRVFQSPFEDRLFHTTIKKKFTYKTDKALTKKSGGKKSFLNQSF